MEAPRLGETNEQLRASPAPSTLGATTSEERQDDRLISLWREQEAIAMHFNNLIARFRLQALGGTATIGAVGAFVTKDSSTVGAWTFVALLGFLFVAWGAVWQLDYGYYHRLLGGSVRSLIEFEERLPAYAPKFSTIIENNFHTAFHGHFWFYTLIQLALGVLLLGAVYRAEDEKATQTLLVTTGAVAAFAAWLIYMAWPSARARARASVAKRKARVQGDEALVHAKREIAQLLIPRSGPRA